MTSQHAEKVWDLIKNIDFCMFVTHCGTTGDIRGRPMSSVIRPEEQAIYFLTDARQRKQNEIVENNHVCLAYADTSGHDYVSISGQATISDDRAKIADIWTPSAQAWWDGPDDPNIRLIRVIPSEAEFWDSPGAIVTYVKMAAAALTGNRPDLGENKKVSL
jgi:general stress protein 26